MRFVSFSDHIKPVTDIRIWGKSGWRFLLAIAMVYPLHPTTGDKMDMHNFLVGVAKVLPCKRCGEHFRDAVKYSLKDKSLANRSNLMRWMHAVQNDIRTRQRKPRTDYKDMIHECLTGHSNNAVFHCSTLCPAG